jgi:carboxymethylenebutenolidase
MTDRTIREQAIALYDHFTHSGMDRRAFMADLTRLAGSATAANALLMAIAADPAAAAVVPAEDKRLRAADVSWPTGAGRTLKGYWASPATQKGRLPAVIVIHENRGLNEHIRDVARRVALAGYHAIAPDFLTPAGGTPAADEDKARAMIGALDMQSVIADATATVNWLKSDKRTTGKIGAVGFCWGGALANWTAVGAGSALAASVPYYGPAPDPSQAAKVKAAMLLQYAANDERVNKTAQPWIDALKAAHVPVEAHFYPGTQHAFNNDTSAERYNKAAADLAWQRTLTHFKAHLR